MQVAVEEITQKPCTPSKPTAWSAVIPLLPRIGKTRRLATCQTERNHFCGVEQSEPGRGRPDSLRQQQPVQRILLLPRTFNPPMRGCVSQLTHPVVTQAWAE